MADTLLMQEARELIEFYDARDKNWENALCFTLCRNWLGERLNVYNPKTHFLIRKRRAITAPHPTEKEKL